MLKNGKSANSNDHPIRKPRFFSTKTDLKKIEKIPMPPLRMNRSVQSTDHSNFMLRIWIFFNKQAIYLEETTTQRNNQIAERACANLERIHSWKYRHPQQSTHPWEVFSVDLFAVFKAIYWGNCTWFNLPRLTAPFIWFHELQLDYFYIWTYCLSRKRNSRSLEAS